ncbi:hypothetical protein CYMTET_33039, partial [Cymbomonas tetramitiformis]
VWAHVHLVYAYAFWDDINLMSRVNSGDSQLTSSNLAGRLAEVYLWDYILPLYTIVTISQGFNFIQYNNLEDHGLVAFYPMEEGAGQQAKDSTARNGNEHLAGLECSVTPLRFRAQSPKCTLASLPNPLFRRLAAASHPPPSPASPHDRPSPSPSPPPRTRLHHLRPPRHRPPTARPPAPPPVPYWSVLFDGINDYLELPSIPDIGAISFWIWLDAVQPPSIDQDIGNYIVDSRPGTSNGVFASSVEDYSLWRRLLLDTEEAVMSWWSLPRDRWCHVYLEPVAVFTDDLTLMCKSTDGVGADKAHPFGCSAGRLSHVALWSRGLIDAEVAEVWRSNIHYDSRHSALLAHYRLEEGGGTSVAEAGGLHAAGTLLNGASWLRDTPVETGPGWISPSPPISPPPPKLPAHSNCPAAAPTVPPPLLDTAAAPTYLLSAPLRPAPPLSPPACPASPPLPPSPLAASPTATPEPSSSSTIPFYARLWFIGTLVSLALLAAALRLSWQWYNAFTRGQLVNTFFSSQAAAPRSAPSALVATAGTAGLHPYDRMPSASPVPSPVRKPPGLEALMIESASPTPQLSRAGTPLGIIAKPKSFVDMTVNQHHLSWGGFSVADTIK